MRLIILCDFLFAFGTLAASSQEPRLRSGTHTEWCPDSPTQLCRMICRAPQCSSETQCAVRQGSCCNYKCVEPTPGKNNEDIYDCAGTDHIDKKTEAKYKQEFDLLDADDNGAISVKENNQAILDKWKHNYGMFCNDDDTDMKKYGLWDQVAPFLNKLLTVNTDENSDKQQSVSGSNDNSGMLNSIIQSLMNGFSTAGSDTDEVDYSAKQRRLQSFHGPHGGHWHGPHNHFNGGLGGWGQDQDVDCSQSLSNRAAHEAEMVMHKFFEEGDQEISFCQYAEKRQRGAANPGLIVVQG